MSKKLSLQKETLVSLQTVDLDQVYGGLAGPVSSARPPVVTAPETVSSVFRPTATAGTGGASYSSVKPTGTAVHHHHHHHTVSSVRPGGQTVSSAKPNF